MPELWEQVKEILALALERPEGERSSFVRLACGENAELRSEVESLLVSYDGADSILENSPAAQPFSFSPTVAQTERRIGSYRILREIGRGGMAFVYLAERADQNYRKRVAIKMVKPGIGTDQLLQRFRNERQTLAALDHPNIVKLLDGGTTEDGLPYLVMDYVEGTAIDRYCDLHKLSIYDRLALFRDVCAAVQYAHQNLVIHRDLKPGNILITSDGLPRLLDFGIAKLLNPEFQQTSLVTRADVHPMTPEYASPEQVRGDPVASTSDIYSLGVLLYEILTGSHPYHIAGSSWRNFERLVCEAEPLRPSAMLNTDQARLKASAQMRAAEPGQLLSLLRGDLDCITMKALDKDPQRRYATASELSADLGRYLSHEPVLARPASAGYRVQKYVRRHPVGVSVAAGVVFLLTAFTVMQFFQLRSIRRERDRANLVSGFMEGMFKVSDPSEARGNSVKAREILDKASEEINTGLAEDPELQAQMMYVMGHVYSNLGLFPQAQALLERSVEIRHRMLGVENADTLRSMDDLGWVLNQEGHAAQAEKSQRETVATRQRVFGKENPDTLKSMSNLAWTLDRKGNYSEAEKLDREVIGIRQRLGIAETREGLGVMSNLAATLGHEGHYAEAEKLKRETLEIRRRILGPEDPDTLTAMNNLSTTLVYEGRYADAERLQRETLDLQQRILGADHPDTLRSMNNLAQTLAIEGRLAEAEKLQREALAAKQRVLGAEHQDTLWSMSSLASTLQQENHLADAEKLLRQTLEIQQRVLGTDRPNTLWTMTLLGITLTKEGRTAEAEKLLQQTVDTMHRTLGPDHPVTLQTTDDLAKALGMQGRYAEAEKLAKETIEIQRRIVGPDHPDTAATTYDLAVILGREGKSDEAISLLRAAIDHGLNPAIQRRMATDPDLKPLHRDPRFKDVLSYVQSSIASQKNN